MVYNSRKSRALIAQATVTTFVQDRRWRKRGDRVDQAAPGPHDDTTCVRILTESGIVWRHSQILYIVMGSPSLKARPETRIHGQEVRVNKLAFPSLSAKFHS